MPFLIAIYVSIAYYTVPKTGALLAMAVIAALFEFFLAGMILHGAFLAILLEGLIAELVFLVAGFKTCSILINGILIQLYTAFHPLLTKGLFCQSSHFLFFKRWFGEYFFNVDNNGLIVTLLSLHVVMGICAGLLVLLVFRLRKVKL